MCRSKLLDSNRQRHGLHSMILVPMSAPGVKKIRPLTVFGQDDAIHGGHFEIHFDNEVIAHWIAECRIAIAETRLLTLHAAYKLDTLGNRAARKEIAMIKVVAGRMASKVVDCTIQVFGGAGLSDDFPLAEMYGYARTLRIADGPDEVHLSSVALLELKDQQKRAQAKL
ncbi:hypothetical protein DNTS_017634 [Danionella cerebrum]|uniref:Acyl-CoA dehydrogenase/oxidase C-terminal domain-containing protein n=1 Tax=Danionella cerebrum TaxID=2873325 RepID=A0A553RG51_9TELE|nr:hypothetical protein DNTS_017634 [Danionella translucida]